MTLFIIITFFGKFDKVLVFLSLKFSLLNNNIFLDNDLYKKSVSFEKAIK